MLTYFFPQEEGTNSSGVLDIGLPNTRNIIKKWSIANLHGVDITALGPPPNAIPLGLGTLHKLHSTAGYNHSFVDTFTGPKGLTGRINEGINSLYHVGKVAINASMYNQLYAKSADIAHLGVNSWLTNTSAIAVNTNKLTHFITDKTDAALKEISSLGEKSVKGLSEFEEKTIKHMRGSLNIHVSDYGLNNATTAHHSHLEKNVRR